MCMNKKVKYIAYYDTACNKDENRNYVLAATNKLDYIFDTINLAGYRVDIISASTTMNKRGYKGKNIQINNNTSLKLFRTFSWGHKANRVISIISMKLFLFFYLLFITNKDDAVFVYHSLGYVGVISLLHKIRKFHLVLEVEEIYADVNGNEKDRKKEYRLFNQADAFLFSTELLSDIVNTNNKPYTILYGTYRVEEDRACKLADGIIHCVYAGTFDLRKGGGTAAAAAAEFLDERYHIHILGFGTEKDKDGILRKIAEVSGKSKCAVTFDGLLSGEDYIQFIQSCHIGLSTQNPCAEFNNTSFPSKVLSYMGNGLRVVSVRIKVLETSKINSLFYYYDENSPESVASAIKRVNIYDDYNSRDVLVNLNKMFIIETKEILREVLR